MKRIIIYLLLGIACFGQAEAQSSINDVLRMVEQNNPTLKVIQKRLEADQLNNKTGIYLQNPEVEFNYLFGNPTAMGNRTDVSITQSFDFPTTYLYERQLVEMKNDQLVYEAKSKKREILSLTRQVCLELVHCNAQMLEYQKRYEVAQTMARSFKLKAEQGQGNQLDENKAGLNQLNAQNDLNMIQVRRDEWLSQLSLLNGGLPIAFTDAEFGEMLIPDDFEEWYQQAEQLNPMLQWLEQEVKIKQKEIQVDKAKQLPGLQAGYMSEKVVGEQFQGITVGISIPVWENKNRVKAARLYADAMASNTEVEKQKFYENLKALHAKAVSQKLNLQEYENNFVLFNNSLLLQKSVESGEISLIEYLYETALNYESKKRMLDLQFDLAKTIGQLNSYLIH